MAKERIDADAISEAVYAAVTEGIFDDRMSQQQADATRQERIKAHLAEKENKKKNSIVQQTANGAMNGIQASMRKNYDRHKPLPDAPYGSSADEMDGPEFS